MRAASTLLVALLLSSAPGAVVRGFVLNGVEGVPAAQLPGAAFRWNMPLSSSSSEGLGGGIGWVLSSSFCDEMIGRFPERDLVMGLSIPSWLQFVHCSDLRDAILRGFATWSANHRLISFADLGSTAPCTTATSVTGELSDACPWELYVGTDDGSTRPGLAAYVVNHRTSALQPTTWYQQPVRSSGGVDVYGVDAHARSVMKFQTHLCWYLDATFCYYFQRLNDEYYVDVLLIVRAVLLAVFGGAALRLLFIIFWCFVALFCLRDEASSRLHRRGGCSSACSACLDYLSSLSPFGNVLVLFFIVFPPVFYDRVFLPCWECYDFEAAVAHEVGHVLGFGHPDQAEAENLVSACGITNATCQRPFDCASRAPYDASEQSIMHSLTQHTPRTCLSVEDMRGLYFLYPLCDALQPTQVSCVKGRRLSGWLRLAIVVGVPFLLAVVAILLPLTCLRWRDRRRMRQMDRDLGRAHNEILEYRSALTQALRSTVRDAISRQSSRPGTALNRIGRVVGGNGRAQGRVHPADSRNNGASARGAPGAAQGRRAAPVAASRLPAGRPRPAEGLALQDVPEHDGGVASAAPPKPKGGGAAKPAYTYVYEDGAKQKRQAVPGQAKPARQGQGRQARAEGGGQELTPRRSVALNGYTGVAWPENATPR